MSTPESAPEPSRHRHRHRVIAALGATAWILFIAVFAASWWQRATFRVQQYAVVGLAGHASLNGQPLAEGSSGVLTDGTRLVTGKDSRLSLRLSEGSLVQLAPDTVVAVVEARTSGGRSSHSTRMRLDAGEVVRRLPQAGIDGMTRRAEVVTAGATITARGAEFAVGIDGNRARLVVHRGAASVESEGLEKTLTENYGTVVASSHAPEDPTVLPPPPELTAPGPSERIDALPLRMTWNGVEGASGYLVEFALDPDFEAPLARMATPDPAATWPELPLDAPVYWRVATLDARGLRGRGSEPRLAHHKVHHASIDRLELVGDGAGALALEPAALRGYATDPALLGDLAWAHYLTGDLAGARALCDRALAQDPKHLLALLRRGRAEFALQDYAASEADYQVVLTLASPPDAAEAWWGLGEVYRATGRTEEALAALEKALAAAPDHAHASLTLAQLLASTDPKRARKLVDKYLAKFPEDAVALELRSQLH